MKEINVVCGIIEQNNKILLAKKSLKKKHPMGIEGNWHIPGGKMKNNETKEEALMREIREELGLEIKIKK
ncbi:MAG: NUDIX domain-containing protein [Candidatus Aenigmatarchaeota archaeon]